MYVLLALLILLISVIFEIRVDFQS